MDGGVAGGGRGGDVGGDDLWVVVWGEYIGLDFYQWKWTSGRIEEHHFWEFLF